LSTVELYDAVTNTFAPFLNPLAEMNTPRASGIAFAITSGPNAGKVLIAGGQASDGVSAGSVSLASTELYDPVTNSFAPASQTASMNTARWGPTATVLTIGPNAGKVLIAGGVDEDALASTELYDPITNSFASASQTVSMNVARFASTATVLTVGPNAGKILIAGGNGTGISGSLTSTELYDPVTNSFAPPNPTASMNTHRYSATATVIEIGPNAGKILIAGGHGNLNSDPPLGPLASTEIYDPVTNTFAPPEQTASMNNARYLATASTIITGPNAGKILIVGGNDASALSSGGHLASTELYDPILNSFAPPNQTASMNTAREQADALTLMTGPNAGRILIGGGISDQPNSIDFRQTTLDSTELYDPVTNSFAPASQTASMNQSRIAPAVQLPDTGPSPISFVGQSLLADYSVPVTAVTVSVPSGVQPGDVLIAQLLIFDGSGTNVPTMPLGWSPIRHDSVSDRNRMTSWLYFKVAGISEPISYTWTISSQYAAAAIRAWRGASSSSPIDQAFGATAAAASPASITAPSLTPTQNNELQVYFYGAQDAAAPMITEPQTITQRLNTMSVKEGFTVAFGDLAAPPEGTPSPANTATVSSNLCGSLPLALSAQTVLLVPEGAPVTLTLRRQKILPAHHRRLR